MEHGEREHEGAPTPEELSAALDELLHELHLARGLVWSDPRVTARQLGLLHLLCRNGHATVGELASRLRVKPPTVSGVLNRLAVRGLVRRASDPRDRRMVRLEPTPAGRALVRGTYQAKRELLRRLLGRMSPDERRALLRGVIALRRAIQAERRQRGDQVCQK